MQLPLQDNLFSGRYSRWQAIRYLRQVGCRARHQVPRFPVLLAEVEAADPGLCHLSQRPAFVCQEVLGQARLQPCRVRVQGDLYFLQRRYVNKRCYLDSKMLFLPFFLTDLKA